MLGKPVPDFSLPSTGGGTFKLSRARGSKLVLYFYPKDEEPVRKKGPRHRAQHLPDN